MTILLLVLIYFRQLNTIYILLLFEDWFYLAKYLIRRLAVKVSQE